MTVKCSVQHWRSSPPSSSAPFTNHQVINSTHKTGPLTETFSFSFGIVLWEIASQKRPLKGAENFTFLSDICVATEFVVDFVSRLNLPPASCVVSWFQCINSCFIRLLLDRFWFWQHFYVIKLKDQPFIFLDLSTLNLTTTKFLTVTKTWL